MYLFAVDIVANAQAALDAGRLVEARVQLESMRGDGRAAALLARVYLGLKMPQQAAAAAQSAARLAPAVPLVQHQLALYFAQSGQRKLAAEWEGRFARSPEADSGAALRAALLFAEVSDWPQVIAFGAPIAARHDRPELRLALARGYEATAQPALAVEQYQALLKLLPGDEATHAAYAQALLRMARFNDATTLLVEARQKFPRSAQLELAYGVALYTQRRFADAGETFLRVIELAPEIPQPYIFLARMIDQLPDRVSAIRARAEAWLRVEARNGFAPFVLARVLHAEGAPDTDVKPLLLEAQRRDATVWEFPYELGQLHERERNFAAAAAAYERSIALNAQMPELHYRLARVYDRIGQPAKAARERALHQKLLAQPKGGMQ